jgi:two-component system OmpR family sensor kinase
MSKKASAVITTKSLWSKISLRTRLTSISVGIVGLLLGVSLTGTVALLKTYLQQNTDSMLIQTANTLALEDPALVEERLATHEITLPALPSDYYIAFLDTRGSLYLGLVSSARQSTDIPNLSQFSMVAVSATHRIPFTASINQGSGNRLFQWRLVAVPAANLTGSVVVGIPMDQNEAIVNQYRTIGIGFSGLLLLISGLALWLTISSALRPLREVSAAADAVRSGAFDRRLPQVEGNTEIAKLNNSLNEMLGSIEGSFKSRNQTLERMKQFVADASHELRTPLVTLRGYAELYRKGAFKSKAQVDDAMQRIESEAIRMSSLVESLLALARLDNDAKLTKQKADLVAVTENVITNIKAGHPKVEINLTDLAGKKITNQVVTNFDDAAIRQIFTNLLNNACTFAGEKPIRVALGNKDTNTVIEVIDQGEGIPKELRKKIFERFYRSDNSRNRDTGGSGLGLAIVKGLVEGHGGKIAAEETKGGGATFRITIPNS